jgi:hypothetical protein
MFGLIIYFDFWARLALDDQGLPEIPGSGRDPNINAPVRRGFEQ